MPIPDPSRLRRVGVDAAVFDSEGRILLQCRADFGKWGLPGGSIEVGETFDQTAIREVKEESGYDVKVERLVGIYSRPDQTTTTYPDGNTVHYVSVVLACRLVGGTKKIDPEESRDAKFFAPADLPHDDLMPEHRERIADALARREAAFIR
jgi:ADP-ribose pyrophosphatase YjhB (NUDIX family)